MKSFDVHCHLEQKDYDEDRDEFIKHLKTKLSGLITCSAHINDLEKSIKISEEHKNFVYLMVGIHPTYIKDLTEKQINDFINKITKLKDKIIAIGEVGLEYHWIKDEKLREKQRRLFIIFINLAKKLNKPLVIHSRDAQEDTFKILEKEGKGLKILLHCFSYHKEAERVKKNKWFVSIGPGILRSKPTRKSAKKLPLQKIMLETDSPWFAIGDQKRGTPENVLKVAEKIAELKKLDIKKVIRQTNKNAREFFGL